MEKMDLLRILQRVRALVLRDKPALGVRVFLALWGLYNGSVSHCTESDGGLIPFGRLGWKVHCRQLPTCVTKAMHSPQMSHRLNI